MEQFYDSKLTLDQPMDWWHQLQGGSIASERPPPPGITDPYPNLARVPAKPVPTDAATRAGLVGATGGPARSGPVARRAGPGRVSATR